MVKQRPRLMARVWALMPRLGFLLPHDRAYHGLPHVVRPDDKLLDVGANNGISALGFRKVLGPDAGILSVEANPAHRRSLARIAARDSNFGYRIVGLGSEASLFTLWTPYRGATPITALASGDIEYCRKAVVRDYGESEAAKLRFEPVEVRVVRMDDLGYDPGLIKVDVEGLDFDVLRGGEATLDAYRPVLLLEYTPGVSGPMLDWLAEKHYDFHVYCPGRDALAGFDQQACDRAWETDPLQVNLYAVPVEAGKTRTGAARGVVQGWLVYLSDLAAELAGPWSSLVVAVA